MFIIRITIILVSIVAFVLLASYVATRDKKYLAYIKHLIRYSAWLALIIGLLFLLSRVIRL